MSVQHTQISHLLISEPQLRLKHPLVWSLNATGGQKNTNMWLDPCFFLFFIGMLYLNNVTTSQNSAVAVSRQTQTPTIWTSFKHHFHHQAPWLGSLLDTHTQACHDNYFCWTVYCPKTVCYKQHYCLFKTILCHWYNDNRIITQVPPFKQQ